MHNIIFILLCVLLLISGCVSTTKPFPAEYFTVFNGAMLATGPLGYTLSAPGEKGLALRSGQVYYRQIVCEFSMQSAAIEGVRNGFLVLYDSSDPDTFIHAGLYIGSQEYAIEGPGVAEPIVVNSDFSQDQVFELKVITNIEEGFIELIGPGRTIGTRLAQHLKKVDTVGFSANSTTTYFSTVKITGE